jgi:hypothetical protein
MDFIRREWLTILGLGCIVVCTYILALKVNQVIRAHNSFVVHTQRRLEALELKAALWEARENDRLASRDKPQKTQP